MADRPILFSAPMVRALIDGRKTQTRRIIKPPPPFVLGDDIDAPLMAGNIPLRFAVGDRLWVRERFYPAFRRTETNSGCVYLADADEFMGGFGRGQHRWDSKTVKWKPSIHMPRWASRITLDVSDARVQRIQDIRHADAKAEGVLPFAPHRAPQGGSCDGDSSGFDDCARCAFKMLWADINGGAAWFKNPWVIALSFAVDRRNIDAAEALRASVRQP